jgi:hypothetical protein
LWSFENQKFNKWDFLTAGLLLVFLWTYLFLRANTVDLIHDEIVSKWVYMLQWNFLPYEGYIDANNHFTNSFIGGLCYRIFNSHSMGIIRLGNVLTFPVYFFSVYSFSHLFKFKGAFYLLVASLLCSAFLIEYFALARGYGLSLAFLLLACSQTILYLKLKSNFRLWVIAFAWLLAVYSNLTLVPFALFSLVFLMIYLIKQRLFKQTIVLILPVLPILYAVQYSLHLKDAGKLYYGTQNGFFETTIHSLTPYLWNVNTIWFDVLLVILSLCILGFYLFQLKKTRDVFTPKGFLPLLFFIAIGNVFTQHILLGINFPEDRAVLYLVIFFLGSLSFLFDHAKIQFVSYGLIALVVFVFGADINLKYSKFYTMDHYDTEFYTKIPAAIMGIPPSTGARKKAIGNEISRLNHFPLRAFQTAKKETDTLMDYIIIEEDRRPSISKLYKGIHTDPVSNVTLWERRKFLKRVKIDSTQSVISNKNEFLEFYNDAQEYSVFVRLKGQLSDWNISKQVFLVFTIETGKNKSMAYETVNLSEGTFISKDQTISFDFTATFPAQVKGNISKLYLWNPEKVQVDGNFEIEIYQIK